jgi:molecular chaperone HscB
VTDPFETFGFEPVFDLDPALLERRHRELSRALHPDRYAGRPASERREALGRAIAANQAFRTLKDPISRAEALLARHGKVVEEGGAQPADPALLMEVLERREALGAAKRARDLDTARRLAKEVGERERAALRGIQRGFGSTPPDLALVEQQLGELRYHRRFLEEVAVIEDEIG